MSDVNVVCGISCCSHIDTSFAVQSNRLVVLCKFGGIKQSSI